MLYRKEVMSYEFGACVAEVTWILKLVVLD